MQSITGASMSGPWSPTVFRENAYIPAAVRDDHGHGEPPELPDLEGRQLSAASSISTTRANRSTSSTPSRSASASTGPWATSGTCAWPCRPARRRRLTAIFDGLRVDRIALAADAVEVYSDRRDTNADGLPDLVADADRGTGQIICNVQRYNPTPAQLAAVPAIQGKTKTTVNGIVPVVSPIGLDNTISECVPFNIMGHGQITPAAADYITTPKWGDRRRRAGLRGAARARRAQPTAGAPGRCRSPRVSRIASSRFTTAPIPSRSTSSGRLSTRRISAFAASPRRCRLAARTCISSRPCRRSRAATTFGRRSASSTCRSGSRRRGAAPRHQLRLSVVGLLERRPIRQLEGRPRFPDHSRSALARHAVARRARGDVHASGSTTRRPAAACSIRLATRRHRRSRHDASAIPI